MTEPSEPLRSPLAETPHAFELGPWRVEPTLRTLSQGSQRVHLEPRVMELLVHLAKASGRVVSREELLAVVWSDVVVNDEAVSRAVSELRKALGDDSRNPTYVQTIHKSGYRLLPPTEAAIESAQRPPGPFESHAAGADSKPYWRPMALVTVAVVAVAVAAGVSGWLRDGRSDPVSGASTLPEPMTATHLTAFPGREIDPAIDAAGERVVYAWNGTGESDEYDLYVQRVGAAEEPLRITSSQGFEGHPSWSPDGRTIAFVRDGGQGASVWAVPATGGRERKLLDLEEWSFGLDWFPDGRALVASESAAAGVSRLVRLSLDSPEVRNLTDPESHLAGDYKPSVSPDGEWVAFMRGGQLDQQDVFAVHVATGEERKLSHSGGRIRGVDWSPDSRRVVYASDIGGEFGLWQTEIDAPAPVWLPLHGQDIFNPVVASNGRLVFESISYQTNLWQVDWRADPLGEAGARLPVRSTKQETSPAISPDGRSIAFTSNRTGRRSLWLSSLDGSNLTRLTGDDDPVVATPVWSPDGTRIAIGIVSSGVARPFAVEPATGDLVSLLDSPDLPDFPAHAIPVAWSRDATRLYFTSDRGGLWNLWSVEVESAVRRQLTTSGGMLAAESTTGDALYFSRPGDPTIYGLLLSPGGQPTGRESRAIGRLDARRHLPWRLVGDAILGTLSDGDAYALARLDLSSGALERVARPLGLYDTPFGLSPDGRQLVYARVEQSESDLMFIDDAFPSSP